jgi:hypothetical protein
LPSTSTATSTATATATATATSTATATATSTATANATANATSTATASATATTTATATMARRTRQSVQKEKPSEAQIQAAIDAVKSGREPSYRGAADSHDVPPATITARARGRCTVRQARERTKALSPAQGQALIQWIERLYKWGFPPRLDMVRNMASKIAGR